ncbi:hypothetical protein IEO21_01085 [Rhodonia placenta]|uniref:Uncharacterized protein n=1 Tax=Rhodonia placenta TaxID=104341 RepID=A0A8H7PAN0_9APHY|nr:hypothetical protein IEO21_01085 [Postia placenta]
MLTDKNTFSSIASFSLASYQFRQIAFRRFFYRLYARNSAHFERCCQIPGMFTWVRNLECSTKTLSTKPDLLAKFDRLQVVEIDFFPDGLATQTDRTKLLFVHLPATITELRLTFLPRIDTQLLCVIASRFPALEMLDLTCTDRLDEECCWLCYEESSSCAVHSPVPDIYLTVENLAAAFGDALKPLKKLEHLFLGIFLSDVDVLHQHLVHRGLEMESLGDALTAPYGPDLCTFCKTGHQEATRKRELVASAWMARSLPSMKTITWSSFFAKSEPGDDTQARMTTAWVRRANGAVQVRRAPW